MSQNKEPDVLRYLQGINRPCSFNDIVQGMRQDDKKALIQKILNTLVSENKIREKVYNKSKIYCCVQPANSNVDHIQNEIKNIEAKIVERIDNVNKLENELKQTETSLAKCRSMLSVEEANSKKQELITSVKQLKSKLEDLVNNKGIVSADERHRIEATHENITKTYKKRKRICNEILDTILENYPKKKSNLVDEIGLELDDADVPRV